ncbi:hypothetical protein IFO70_24840 [Phormidium tenue FACHB-886]|nr:hypothetical protein [Phormidium tenue FACHB-886]
MLKTFLWARPVRPQKCSRPTHGGYYVWFVAVMSLCLNSGLTEEAFAAAKSCNGASCNDKDPIEYGCDADAQVLDRATRLVNRWQENWQPQRIVIEHLYSEVCHASWTKAYIPDDTYLFIREQTPVNGIQPVRGMFQAQGAGYFWAYGKMSDGYSNQACVSLSILSSGSGHDLFDRYCTDFN